MMKKTGVLALVLLAIGALAGAQTLAPQATAPTIDGVMNKGEYAYQQATKDFWVGAALSQDKATLSLGLVAATKGWISIGLGSMRMNGSYIVIGYDQGGKVTISEDKGVGHGHSPAGTTKVIKYAIKTVGNQTTMEFSIPAAEWIKNGKLQLILGAANTADLISFHPKFGSLEIAVAK